MGHRAGLGCRWGSPPPFTFHPPPHDVMDDCLNERAGVYCSLLTGQEKRIVPFAEHTSATVEMANLANVRTYVCLCIYAVVEE